MAYDTQSKVDANVEYTRKKWLSFYKNHLNWKVEDMSLYIKHKLANEKDKNNQKEENEEKIDYQKLENGLKKAKIEQNSVKCINKPLQNKFLHFFSF